MVTVERFDISKAPDHGRPRVVEFRDGRGVLGVHVERDTGALWVFATGSAGGSHGPVVFPVRMAERLLAWVDGGARKAAPSTSGVLWLDDADDDARTAVVKKDAMHARRWRMLLDLPVVEELLTCFREWAEAVLRVAS